MITYVEAFKGCAVHDDYFVGCDDCRDALNQAAATLLGRDRSTGYVLHKIESLYNANLDVFGHIDLELDKNNIEHLKANLRALESDLAIMGRSIETEPYLKLVSA